MSGTFALTVTDWVNNSNVVTFTIIRDDTPPEITGEAVRPFIQSGNDLTFDAWITDTYPITDATVAIDGVSSHDLLDVGSGWTATRPGDLVENVYPLTFSATDQLGNTATTTNTLIVADTDPTVDLSVVTTEPYGEVISNTMYFGRGEGAYTVTAQVSTPLAGLDTVEFGDATSTGILLPQNGLPSVTLNHEYTFTASSTFSNTLAVAATDRAANTTISGIPVIRDIVSPTVSVSAQSSGLDITLSWSASDDLSGLDTCLLTVKIGGGDDQELSTDCSGTMTYPGTQDVEHTFSLSATDKVSNPNTGSASTTPNSVTKYYYLGADRVAMRNGDGVFYLHGDHLGSTSLTTGEDGEVVSESRYYPYGEERFSGGSKVTDWAFTGQRIETGFGLLDYNARFYSPRTGRFISPDTLIPDLTSSQDWNRYGYVKNNPLKYQDSSGNFAFLPWLLKAGTEAAVDAMVQAAFAYYFDPEITSIDQAIGEISWSQVGWAGVTGLMPGSGLAKSAAVAVGDVLINFAELGDDYTAEQALKDFIISVGAELVGEKAGELVAKYGPDAFGAGMRKLGLSGGCSFSAETLVLTKTGLRPIVELIIGDIVYSYNEVTGEFGWYQVTATFAHLDPEIVLLTINGEVIETTPEHPFMVMEAAPWLALGQVDERWIEADNLSVGDDILRADGTTGDVDNVAVVAIERWMYNITVGEAHTFFVGYGEWLVHNACSKKLRENMASAGSQPYWPLFNNAVTRGN